MISERDEDVQRLDLKPTDEFETYMKDVLQVPVLRGYLARLCTGLITDSLDDRGFDFKGAVSSTARLMRLIQASVAWTC